MHAELYNTDSDCLWLSQTHLTGKLSEILFLSFTIAGNEDFPLEIRLYTSKWPKFNELPTAVFKWVEEELTYIHTR